MAEKVASILAEIGIDTGKFTAGVNGVMGGIGKMIGGFGKMAGGIGIAATAIGVMVDQLKKYEAAAVDAAKIDAKLEAVLRSTGNAVGFTTDQLDAYATSLSKMSGIDDEAIKNSEAVLLTFTKIGKESFMETMQAALDMSAVLGTDLQGSIIQVGKAMNDFSGYTALKRSGVSFTQTQIDQINKFKETNDLISYQKLLLGELQTEFGGAAEAMEKAGDGSENLKIAWGNLQEAMGKSMVSSTRNMNEDLTKFVDNTTEAINTTTAYRDALESLGITQTLGSNYIRNGTYITQDQVKAMVAASQAAEVATDRFDKMNPEVKKLGESGREAADGIGEIEGAADGASTGIDNIAKSLGILSGVDLGFGDRIAEAMRKIEFRKAGGVELQGISEAIISGVETGSIGLDIGNALLTQAEIGSIALAVKTGEMSAYEAKSTIVETLGLTWAEADSQLSGWLANISSKTATLNVLVKYSQSGMTSYDFAGMTHEQLERYLNRDLDTPPNGIGRERGGPIWANHPYVVGEGGPELVVPSTNGTVIPNNQLGGNVVNFFGDAYFAVENEVGAENIMKQMRVAA